MLVFILNAGSSSLKYQLMNPVSKEVLAVGLCERIGIDGVLKHEFGEGQKLTLEVPMPTHKEAIELVLKTLVESEGKVINSIDDIDAIGHRAVHGGEEFASSVMVTPRVVETMKKLIPLAPLHNPANIMGMEICQELMPGNQMLLYLTLHSIKQCLIMLICMHYLMNNIQNMVLENMDSMELVTIMFQMKQEGC